MGESTSKGGPGTQAEGGSPAPGDSPFVEAVALQQAAARDGFDWPDADGVLVKVAEELEELRTARTAAERAEELGDLLFVLASWARHHGLDLPASMALANTKFSRRYAHVQSFMAEYPRTGPARLTAMDARWDEAKRIERGEAVPRASGDLPFTPAG